MGDEIFQKSQFSICELHGINFLMDFSWITCISETLRKISFKASGSYAKITYFVLIHMSQGRTGLLPLFEVKKRDSNMRRLGQEEKWGRKDYNAIHRATTMKVLNRLDNKVCKVMEFSPYFEFQAFQSFHIKLVKIDFSNNSIIESK